MEIKTIKNSIFFLFFFSSSLAICGQNLFMKFDGYNIGNPKQKGNFLFDEVKQEFTVEGGGYNIWFTRDEFYFVSLPIEGNFIFSANLKFLGKGMESHRKMGLMIRAAQTKDAVYMDGVVHGDGLTSLQYRENQGKETKEIATEIKHPDFIQVERKNNLFIFRISKNGEPLCEVGRITLDMPQNVFAGMFVCSHNENILERAKFWNVRIEKPAPDGIDGYQTPSPSRLEILDIETGYRTIIDETEAHIEAPNWSRDGKFLIYNSGGKLYRFDLKSRTSQQIHTGFADAINNDHGISFDGKTIAISHDTQDNDRRHSIIYTLPITEGWPTRITPLGPSYWHGWSPDDKWLCYCAERNGNYDIYKIPATGGEEIRLTTADGLDDGPEYSPDGKYIYFNSERSGHMEIWRMKPDGSEQQQVTNDEYQNWFAHPSPDGKHLIFISYLPEVPANSHPHNQRVMLRLMPIRGDKIRVMAFLYGGQGTINVPSWSPDSKRVAFVSYTY